MRRVRRKAVNKEKVFGCDLLEHLAASCQEIPQVLRSCCEFVEEHGIVDGIYRLSGVSSNTQKLRGEFDSDTPDLNKDVYLQDIHCVSSLCKAYFRELPNPLLTYQLYDMFAEAVAIQLEEERLVKIRDVLKELPAPHFMTLEFLMRHLVKMASYSNETNMHARNLAIVWAPNLLRSKDIEVSGLNGTAAFMEVRVQSIVVEFILTHVPQLFPEKGGERSAERRKSLPSPSALSNSEFFRGLPMSPTVSNIGHISIGDGPLPIRPYHSIIEPTEKRKGSLKGRKWTSIFNLGGRLHDPRRRHKNSTKEKEKTALRPAKSMDSLSSPCLHEGSMQRSPSSHHPHISPLAQTTGGEAGAPSSGAGIGSGYAVTYRRGMGASVSVVSGGKGTQGTYSILDHGGMGATGAESLHTTTLSRSPGVSGKAGRRAGIHISGPLSVTVPLHITSGLAFGVLQGGGGDTEFFRGSQGVGDRVEGGEEVGGEKKEKGGVELTMYESEEREDVREAKSKGGKSTEEEEVKEEKVKEEDRRGEEKVETDVENMGREEEALADGETDLSDGNSCNESGELKEESEDGEEEYMDMKGPPQADQSVPDESGVRDTMVTDTAKVSDVQETQEGSGIYDSSEDDELPLDFQDTFGFLDLMDSSASNQMNEFSVEPPCYGDEEYDEDILEHEPVSLQQQRPDRYVQPPANTQRHTIADPQAFTDTSQGLNLHRPLAYDKYGRQSKSMSLPYRTAFHPALTSSSDEDDEDDDDDEYEDEKDNDMFYKSLPSSLQFQKLWGASHENALPPPTVNLQEWDCPIDHGDQSQSSEPALCQDPPMDTLEQSQAEGEEGLEQEEEEDSQENDKGDILMVTPTQSTEMEDVCHSAEPRTTEDDEAPDDTEESLASVSSTTDCTEAWLSGSPDPEEVDAARLQVKDKEEVLDNHHQCEGEFSEGLCADIAIATDVSEAHGLQVCQTSSRAAEPEPESNLEEDTEEKVERNREDEMLAGGDRGIGNGEEREIAKEMGERKEDVEKVEERDQGEPMEGEEERLAEENDEKAEKIEGQDEAICSDVSLEVNDDTCEIMTNGEKTDEEQMFCEGETKGRGIVQEVAEVKEEGEGSGGENGGTIKELEEECSTTDEEQMEDTLTEIEREKKGMQPHLVLESNTVDLIQGDTMEDVTEDKNIAVSHVNRDAGESMPIHQSETEESHSKEQDTAEEERETREKMNERQMQTTLEERDEELKEILTDTKEGRDVKAGLGTGVGRMLVVSKQTTPKVHQVKSVPIVPPKPQHCRLTAQSMRHQQQEREKRETDREKERVQRVQEEQPKVEEELEERSEDDQLCESEQGGQEEGEDRGKGRKERRESRGGERERRRHGDEGGVREVAKSSPSVCFDEAVAMATLRRERKKESAERERQGRDKGEDTAL